MKSVEEAKEAKAKKIAAKLAGAGTPETPSTPTMNDTPVFADTVEHVQVINATPMKSRASSDVLRFFELEAKEIDDDDEDDEEEGGEGDEVDDSGAEDVDVGGALDVAIVEQEEAAPAKTDESVLIENKKSAPRSLSGRKARGGKRAKEDALYTTPFGCVLALTPFIMLMPKTTMFDAGRGIGNIMNTVQAISDKFDLDIRVLGCDRYNGDEIF